MHTNPPRSDPHAQTRTLTAGPALGEATIGLVCLHGRGAGADDAIALGRAIAPPGACVLAPEAAGRTWYPLSFLAPIERNQPFVDSALARVAALIDEVRAAGIPRERTLLAGFSQGACLASEFLARSPDAVAAAAILTGGLIGERIETARHRRSSTPVRVIVSTGDPDPHVPLARVRESAEALRSLGLVVETQVHPGRPHAVSSEEVEAVRAFFTAAIASA